MYPTIILITPSKISNPQIKKPCCVENVKREHSKAVKVTR